jgi:glucosylceramidase
MGGPNHANNFSHSPIMVQMKGQKLIINPSYYYIAQFSRYVQRGAKRLESKNHTDLPSVTFVNPDGIQVMVILYPTPQERVLEVKSGDLRFQASTKPRSLSTFWWRAGE